MKTIYESLIGSLDSACQELLEYKLDEIMEVVESAYLQKKQVGVLSGLSGMALLPFYYAKHRENPEKEDLGIEILSACIDMVNEGFSSPTFCGGLAGMGWAFEHLDEKGLAELDNDDTLSQLDEYLIDAIRNCLQHGNYDFLHGATGIAFYFFKRYNNTRSLQLKNQYEAYLKEYLILLEKNSIQDGNALKWRSLLERQSGKTGFNLSLSHGVSSIVNVLSRMYVHPTFQERVKPLLEKSVQFILDNKIQSEDGKLAYSNWITDDQEYHNRSRLAWCYGDLGTGLTLLRAAQVLEDTQLYTEAVNTLKVAAGLVADEDTLVRDAGICHGSYGNALIFKKIYNVTQEPLFWEKAMYWLEEGLQMATFSDGYAGYKQFEKGNQWNNKLSVLEGVSGIGMVIIDFLSEEDLSWDECLLIS